MFLKQNEFHGCCTDWLRCMNGMYEHLHYAEVSLWIMMISALLVPSECAALPVTSLVVPHVQEKDGLVRQRTNVRCSGPAAGSLLWFWVGHLAAEPSLTGVIVDYVTDWSRVGSLRVCVYAVPEQAGLLRNLMLVWSLTHFYEAMLLTTRYLLINACGSPGLSKTPIICFCNVWCLNSLKKCLAAVLQEGQVG